MIHLIKASTSVNYEVCDCCGQDIRIAGGADLIQQYLNAGMVDELEIALAPVLFGSGRRLFENNTDIVPSFRIEKVLDTPLATHIRR